MNADELRQLDREMAGIMGWTLEEWSTSGVPYEPLYRTGPTSHLAVVAWHPTSDIGQAWMVVEVIRGTGWRFSQRQAFTKALQLIVSRRVLADADETCRGMLLDSRELILFVEPLDICLAAKAATEGER